MSLSILIQGTIAADPQERTSSAGKPYCTALVRVAIEGEESILASAIAFNQGAVTKLMALHKGDAVAMAGPGKLTGWTGKDGEIKRGLGITAESVMSVYEVRRRKSEMAEQQEALA